jgi:hypothetical protein
MTRTFGLLLAALLLPSSIASAEDLTLRDVIELHRSGLGEDLLIAVIDADGGPFSLGFADIQDLKSDGLSERVIAALVRTGSRREIAAGQPPVIEVRQDVINYIVPAVIVVDSPHADERIGRRTEGDRPGRHLSREDGRSRRPAPPPPATWVTQREDGKNVSASEDHRKGVQAATWVTPREPKARDPKPAEKPQPRP